MNVVCEHQQKINDSISPVVVEELIFSQFCVVKSRV